MNKNPNLEIIDRFVAAVFSSDTETLKSLCDEELVLHEGTGFPFTGRYHGAEGFLHFLQLFNDTFDIEKLEPVRTYTCDDQDYIICEMDLKASVRATGKEFASSLLERWQFRNGKVLDIKPHYFDTL